MRGYNDQSKWQKTRGKKRAHWGILTLDDLDKANERHSQLITLFKARNQAAAALVVDQARLKSEDFSI